ncbi:MAG: ABC transporter permease, partial [Rhodospirillales bacterium]
MNAAWTRLARDPPAAASAVALAAVAAVALLAPALAALLGLDPNAVDLSRRFQPPSARHWLGTDEIGRDVLLRLVLGGQVSLFVGLVAALAAAVIGTAVGLVAGYRGGKLDDALMRLTDGVIALPLLPLLIVMAALDLSKLGISPEAAGSPAASFWRIVAIIALV